MTKCWCGLDVIRTGVPQLQEVLIRSVEGVLAWLGGEEEPWVGPRLKLHLVLEDGQVVLSPDQQALISAFKDLFKEVWL